ncbi:hypothetical protein BDW67DRAFT_156767 [Aspergillus spinulosporus]
MCCILFFWNCFLSMGTRSQRYDGCESALQNAFCTPARSKSVGYLVENALKRARMSGSDKRGREGERASGDATSTSQTVKGRSQANPAQHCCRTN